MITAHDNSQDYHQNGTIEGPITQCGVRSHKLTGRSLGIEDAINAVFIVRIVLASVQNSFPVIKGDSIGDARDNTEKHDKWIKYRQPLFRCVLLHCEIR